MAKIKTEEELPKEEVKVETPKLNKDGLVPNSIVSDEDYRRLIAKQNK